MTENIKTNVVPLPLNSYTDLNILMNDWHLRLCNAQKGHYSRSEKLYCRANWSGYILIFSTTIVTAMLFLEATGYLKVILILMSIISAALSGVVSFARFAEQAETHRSAAGCYGKLRRQLEILKSRSDEKDQDGTRDKLKVLRIEWEYISGNAPLTPKSAIK